MGTFYYFISIVWWVLCIILFLKIWRACNDIRKIKNQIDQNDDFNTRIDFLMRIGENEKAKEIFIAKILSDDSIFNTTSTPVEKMEELFNKYQDEFKRLGIPTPQKEEK